VEGTNILHSCTAKLSFQITRVGEFFHRAPWVRTNRGEKPSARRVSPAGSADLSP
jgi:hypothetical protein